MNPEPRTKNPQPRTPSPESGPPNPVRAYIDLARPFTLVAPALGFISGALTAIGAVPREPWAPMLLVSPIIGSVMAAMLNAGNNALNQIYDFEIDRVNKAKRPLPSGRLTFAQAWRFTIAAYAIALVLAWLVEPHRPALTWSAGRHECFWLVAIAVVCTYIYSVPPLRTKRLGIWANITIAIPRLPIQFGVSRAAWMISPSFVIPFLMIPVGAWLGILTGSFWLLQLLGIVMTLYGLYVCYLMLRRPEELAVEENHVSWAHMYRMMFVAQIGFALAYLL
ncbi:MAG: hypothetical protein DMG04_08955 [Acidobacteria bacterium]|nr:MAG: hypothetical protein DMG04_08955 [Acidobacteriota bacterium]